MITVLLVNYTTPLSTTNRGMIVTGLGQQIRLLIKFVICLCQVLLIVTMVTMINLVDMITVVEVVKIRVLKARITEGGIRIEATTGDIGEKEENLAKVVVIREMTGDMIVGAMRDMINVTMVTIRDMSSVTMVTDMNSVTMTDMNSGTKTDMNPESVIMSNIMTTMMIATIIKTEAGGMLHLIVLTCQGTEVGPQDTTEDIKFCNGIVGN